ncbi:UNVERIFIED_CONTAM: Zeta-carotene desaturase, chloroplastic/chromoplastic [Sesamum latifolium]|uniref:Zeta-carotene desaturase, chloroplastic/chromoplastic n=1 Tax=Sesamum latifolium TaxID=2727402 RepID=A0AAW2YE68_9LAMI
MATPTATTAACLCFPPNRNFRIRSAGFCNRHYSSQFKGPPRLTIRADLESNVSDMRVNAPKGLFPPEPEHYKGPKLKVAIIGAGLAGMSTAVELLDQGHEVDIYESRPFIGGKVGSYVDKQGNHIEMGLHVFFGCYNNLFRLMKKNLIFVFPVGAPLHGIRAFLTTNQLKTYDIARNAVALALSPVVRALVDPDGALGDVRDLDNISFSDWFLSRGGTRTSIQRLWDPVAYALGFIDCDNISARYVYLSGPIRKYIMDKGGRFHLRWGCREILYDRSSDGDIYVKGLAMSKATQKKIIQADAYVAACDVPGIKRLLPQNWRESEFFDNIYKLVGVPVVTVQLRYNGWVTELRDLERARQLRQAAGLDNLLYTPDADFSCFADLALTSPEDYYLEGQGSLLQCVLTPGDPYMPLPNEEIVKRVSKQWELRLVDWRVVRGIAADGGCMWIGGKGYEGAGGVVGRFWICFHLPKVWKLHGPQLSKLDSLYIVKDLDYIDSMEGATLSGRQASAYICNAGENLVALRKALTVTELKQTAGAAMS